MSLITRITSSGVQAVSEVTGLSLSRDGRYVLADSQGGFAPLPFGGTGETPTFRYDNHTGGRLPGLSPPVNASGIDLSGDGRYWTLVLIRNPDFPHGIGDFTTQSQVAGYVAGLRGAGYRLGAISDKGQAVALIFHQASQFGNGPSDVRISYWQTGIELRVPGTGGFPSLTDDSISGAGERVVFADNGSVYYADAAGGAPGFTQAPILIAAGANASISANGRFVVFESGAALLAQDTYPGMDIYLKDLQTGTLTLVSTASDGTAANSNSIDGAVSNDGRYVVFQSSASNLVPGDTNAANDIFLKDLLTGETRRLSVSNDGVQANGHSLSPEISSDGSTVIFMSNASNLAPEDTNGIYDTFRVSLTGVRHVAGDSVAVTDSYQMEAGERSLSLESATASFGYGNGLDNTLVSNGADNTLRGFGGNDTIVGQGGNDYLDGGSGNDFLDGGDGNDVILGGAGADQAHGGPGNDFIDGGEGDNPWLVGEAGQDTIIGGSGADGISGGDGDDPWLAGQGGADSIYGGAGNDGIAGGDGNDPWLAGEGGADSIYGGAGDDVIFGGAGDDPWLAGEDGNDFIMGGDGNDTVSGGAGDDFNLYGDDGADFVYGGDGNDRLFGGGGNDQLFGDGGDDHLNGQAGADQLAGGNGRDQFFFSPGTGGDTVIDFQDGQDILVLAGFGFTAAQVETRIGEDAAGNAYINLDNGDIITLLGVQAAYVNQSDFIIG
jgi:Ca2+-binding RTX toxin-like protein